jgi:aryl-alcohol dehydrogenase-like predicted oxidoreductase
MSGPAASASPTHSRLALGTAQFGMNYGVANQSGQVTADEVGRILALARTHGVNTLDTAMDYGNSEASLGAQGVAGFQLVTKLSAMPDDVADVAAWVRAKVAGSLQRLQLDAVHGLLLHRPHQLLGVRGPALARALQGLKDSGLVRKIGVSIYAPEELDSVSQACPVDLVQAPFSLIDQRLHASGWMDRLHAAGVEIHVRSAFLQGLLLMPRAAIPDKFNRVWSPMWDAWHAWLADHPACSAAQACIGFVQGFHQVDRIVVGVDGLAQFGQLIAASSAQPPADWPAIGVADEALVNPSKWNSL